MAAVLHRLFEKQLVAETHTEHRLAFLGKLHHPPAETGARELLQRGSKGSDPGQHQAVRPLELILVGCEPGLGADVQERTLDRAQVADAIVDDRNHPRRPLDDGTAPPACSAIASRSAKPSALNVASAM